jgi:hypothetical protein
MKKIKRELKKRVQLTSIELRLCTTTSSMKPSKLNWDEGRPVARNFLTGCTSEGKNIVDSQLHFLTVPPPPQPVFCQGGCTSTHPPPPGYGPACMASLYHIIDFFLLFRCDIKEQKEKHIFQLLFLGFFVVERKIKNKGRKCSTVHFINVVTI